MTSVPKTREALLKELIFEHGLIAEDILDAIEGLGVRLVPAEPTERMVKTYLTNVQFRKTLEEGLAAAISASPYAPDKEELDRDVLPSSTEAKC